MTEPLALPPPTPTRFAARVWLSAMAGTAMLLAAAAALALAARSGSAPPPRLVVQLIEARADRRGQDVAGALALLRATPGVVAARPRDRRELAALLGPYLPGLAIDDLPLPALIDVVLERGADRGLVARRLRLIPSARIDGSEGGGTNAELAPLRRLALILFAAAGATVAALAALAARAALDGQAAGLALVHALGATDRQMAGLIVRPPVRAAAAGAALATLLSIAVLATLGPDAGAAFGWGDWLLLALIPPMMIALTYAAAHITARVAIGRMR